MRWTGQALPRSEDRYLLSGHGQFTADVARGAMSLVFVRSTIAKGTIRGIEAPAGAIVIKAADLGAVRPIRPLLHRPDYVAVSQPILPESEVS